MTTYDNVREIALDENARLVYGLEENVDVESMSYDDAVEATIEWLYEHGFTVDGDLYPLFRKHGF